MHEGATPDLFDFKAFPLFHLPLLNWTGSPGDSVEKNHSFIHSLIHSVIHKYLLKVCDVPNVDVGDTQPFCSDTELAIKQVENGS